MKSNRRSLLVWLFVFAVLAGLAGRAANTFEYYLTVNDSRSLDEILNNSDPFQRYTPRAFGFSTSPEEGGYPFFFSPSDIVKDAYFSVGGAANDPQAVDWTKLYTKTVLPTSAYTWVFKNDSASKIDLVFHVKSGTAPAKSAFNVVNEAGETVAAIKEGAAFQAPAGATLYFKYSETGESGFVPAAPANMDGLQMINAKNATIAFDFAEAPEGYEIELDPAVCAYIQGAGVLELKSSNYGTVNSAEGTYSLPGDSSFLEKAIQVQLAYRYVKTADKTQKSADGLIFITLTNDLTVAIDKLQAVTTEGTTDLTGTSVVVDPAAEGYVATDITYVTTVSGDFLANPAKLTYTFQFPNFKLVSPCPYSVSYATSTDGSTFSAFSKLDITVKDGVTAGTFSATPSTQKYYIKLRVTATTSCEGGQISGDVSDGTTAVALPNIRIIIFKGFSLDLDGDGFITNNDAMFLYNFVLMECGDWVTGDLILDFTNFDDTVSEEERVALAETALQNMRANLVSLDLDSHGAEGMPDNDDAMYFYNFVLMECGDWVEGNLILDFTNDSTEELAEGALKVMREAMSGIPFK